MLEHKELKNLFIVNHPLIGHKLTHMRDINCNKMQFKSLLNEIGYLMGYEITRHLPITTKTIQTPLCEMEAPIIKGKKPVIVPILRAGLGMSEGLERLIPNARVGHIGLYRDHENNDNIVEYYAKMPNSEGRQIYLVDPMLATGNSAVKAVETMIKFGVQPKNVRFMVLVAAPEGVRTFHKAYPEIPIYTASLDKKLNENNYIIPGLGDAGDRLFGTK